MLLAYEMFGAVGSQRSCAVHSSKRDQRPVLTDKAGENTFAAMKTCPVCQETVNLNLRVCPRCGHRFIPAILWVSAIVIALFAFLGALLLRTL